MCGIAGIIGHLNEPNRTALERMHGALVHRGPDAEGFWEAEPDARGRGVLLAHRRLSILDLSPSGAQPMVDRAAGDVVVLNGEIFNYRELREDLRARGHTFRSSGDTEVVLKALVDDNANALTGLRGMFALAFWAARSRRLLVARDPLGIKPLYLARNPDPHGEWSVAFASEVRALLASGLLVEPRLNPLAVGSLVWNGFTIGPETAVEGVVSLQPGEAVVFDETGREVSRRRYWNIPEPDSQTADARSVVAVLEDSVRLHLASDVPLGVFLSSGVDSASVANLAQRSSSERVHTFTLGFEETDHDEGPMARRIAAAIGTDHHEVTLTESQFVGRVDDAVDSLDQPTFDGINSYFMSHAVREAGFTVALVGTGGDELFGGYASFRDLPRAARLARRARSVPRPLTRAAAQLFARLKLGMTAFPQQTRWAKLPDMVDRGDDLIGLYQMAYALFLPAFQDELVSVDVRSALIDGLPAATHSDLRQEIGSRPTLEAVSVLEQRLFLGERLLRDTDAASMSASLEVRLPLVDQVVLAEVNRLPSMLRFDAIGSKSLLRHAGLGGLDPALFQRPKVGFELPFDRWLRNRLGGVIDATLRDPVLVAPTGLCPRSVARLWTAFQDGNPGLYWSRIWAIYAFIRWCHRNHVHV